jgi:hypothetical protein
MKYQKEVMNILNRWGHGVSLLNIGEEIGLPGTPDLIRQTLRPTMLGLIKSGKVEKVGRGMNITYRARG